MVYHVSRFYEILTIYDVTGEPPSSSGAEKAILTEFDPLTSTCAEAGALGAIDMCMRLGGGMRKILN